VDDFLLSIKFIGRVINSLGETTSEIRSRTSGITKASGTREGKAAAH
jgi:hypothetical protein